ncbi:TerY-C metal binding domain-containing protein [Tenacibaculum finnmarkense]|uniref:TerY-C metal binding domain-containing protein n=1 Tax=Tenacibaculum finnmarkense TaxID=2781243 RepID=UPI001E5963C6|nr:TerY-C metal binding domain-containing protein [Tenacibaculum finnmarkense]MCD8422883.1 VWA domain-containing protein [Tenacibaculum finnmarkense genomovar ulcerans]MCG8238888.1 VWA domain-containing protein [Tenacibaculum finnmarkense genomovar ulcerans]
MRRLPIYFLIDVSESMVGDPIGQVQDGISTIIQELKTDPNSLETVWISIIVFAGEARTIVPLQDIISFYPPKFPIGSGTSLSKGLGHLMHDLRKNLVKTSVEKKGDWKPIVFLFTDGVPTDDTTTAISEWNKNWKRTANLIAVSLGNGADKKLLGKLTDNILELENTDASGYREFFKWVTDSIKTSSESVDTNKSGFELAKFDSLDLSIIDIEKLEKSNAQHVDDNFVVLSAMCQNTKKTYLMKYKKLIKQSSFAGIELGTKSYRLNGAFQVDSSYEELSDESSQQLKVNTEELIGAPTCPCCGNQIAFAVCQCNQIHCIGEEEITTCPKCGNTGRYTAGTGGFDVNRTQG